MTGPIVLLARPLKLGSRGDDVIAMKRALSRAGYGRWIGFSFTKLLGENTVRLLARFQKDHGLRADGEYGPATHKRLAPHYDAYGAKLMNDAYHRLHETPARKAIAAAMAMFNYHRLTGRTRYTQGPSRWSVIARKLLPPMFRGEVLYQDCSSSVTSQDWLGGNPDPNGLGFRAGYTGTLSVHGRRIAKPALGALAFYGFSWPYHHVTRCVGFRSSGEVLVWSFGSNPPKITVANYRGDLNHWRSY